jgi:hypothetical protein
MDFFERSDIIKLICHNVKVACIHNVQGLNLAMNIQFDMHLPLHAFNTTTQYQEKLH